MRTGDLRRLPAGVRRDLLRVLTSPSNIRADVRPAVPRAGDNEMVDVLADLEADDLLRERVIHVMRHTFH